MSTTGIRHVSRAFSASGIRPGSNFDCSAWAWGVGSDLLEVRMIGIGALTPLHAVDGDDGHRDR